MTIYNIRLSRKGLSQIKSARIIQSLCTEVSLHIINHILLELGSHVGPERDRIDTCLVMMQWYLGMIERAIGETPTPVIPIRIGLIYVEKIGVEGSIKKVISMDKLGEVDPGLLLEFFNYLVKVTIDSLAPRVVSMTSPELQCWVTRILEIPLDLLTACESILKPGGHEAEGFSLVMVMFCAHDDCTGNLDYV